MKTHWLWRFGIVFIVLVLMASAGFVLFKAIEQQKPFDWRSVGDVALILTLSVLITYTYFTYSLSKEAWTPSASFKIQFTPVDPYKFTFFVFNHSKFPIECWCKFNGAVCGMPLPMGGFFSGEKPLFVQPFGRANASTRDIGNLVPQCGYSVEDLEALPQDKKRFYCKIEFSYNTLGTKRKVQWNAVPYFFCFRRKIWVYDA